MDVTHLHCINPNLVGRHRCNVVARFDLLQGGMDSDPPKTGASGKTGLGVPFLLSFRSRSSAGSSSDSARSSNIRAQSDVLGELRSAIEQLLQPKVSFQNQRSCIRLVIDTLKRDPSELDSILDPAIATPLVSSLVVLCSRLLRDTFAYEIRLLSCELLTSTLKYADVSTQSVSSELSKEEAMATGWNAVMPSRAMSMLDRALLYRLVVNLHRYDHWNVPLIVDEPELAFQTLSAQLSALLVLTRDGRDIFAFKGILNVLMKWLRYTCGAMLMLRTRSESNVTALSEHCMCTLVNLLASICKFNASRLDKKQMEQFVNGLCGIVLYPRIPRYQAPANTSKGYSYYDTQGLNIFLTTPTLKPVDEEPKWIPPTEMLGIPIGVDDVDFPPFREQDIRVFVKVLDAVFCYAFIPSECLTQCVLSFCRVIGLPIAQADQKELIFRLAERSVDIQAELEGILNNFLSSHFVHSVIQRLYEILCGPRHGPRSIRVGAFLFIYATMIWSMQRRIEQGAHVKQQYPILPQSVFEGIVHGALLEGDDVIDLISLFLIDDYLPQREACPEAIVFDNVPARNRQTPKPLCTLYPDSGQSCWNVVLDLTLVMNRHLSRHRRGVKELSLSSFVLHMLVFLLCTRTDRYIISMPFVSSSFWALAPFIPDCVLLSVIKENEQQHMYLPSSPDWLDKLTELVDTFYPRAQSDILASRALPSVNSRHYALQIITKVYECVQDLPHLLEPLIDQVIMPLTKRASRQETNMEIGVSLRRIMRHAMTTTVCHPSIGKNRPFFHMLHDLSDAVFRAEPSLADSTQAVAQHSRQRSLGPHNVSDVRDGRLRFTRATRSTRDLIVLFMQLSFGITDPADMLPEFDVTSNGSHARLRECSIAIFRELLRMVRSNTPFSSGSNDANASSCVPPQLRQVILRWMLRLRSDRQHRIYFQDHVEDFSKSLMTILSRTEESDLLPTLSYDPRHSELKMPSWSSRIWTVFENEELHTADGSDHAECCPLLFPVSEYLNTVVHVLQTETDWDVLSTLLVHLPSQLNNMHLFCGKKASAEICGLRNWLCPLLLEQKPLSNLILPEDVRRTDLTAVLYATLKVLISYHRHFTRAQQDELVETFVVGLSHSQTVAQPCVRALVVAGYEISKSFTRQWTNILVKLSTIMSSITMSVHILELLAEFSSVQALYANFTEADYRRVFGIALQYIQFHESVAAGSTRENLRSSAAKFVLAQYVLLLAYNNISQWFMTLRLSERAKHASYITQGLVLANEGRDSLSDQTIVCLDFLARFTYSNALPKPSRSLLHMLLDQKGQEPPGPGFTWIVGKGLVTVRPMARNGTYELVVRRPSGTVSFVSRMENMTSDDRTAEERTADILAAAIEHWKQQGSIAKPVIRAPRETEPTVTPSSKPDHSEEASPEPNLEKEETTHGTHELEKPTLHRTSGMEPIFLALQFSGYPDKSQDKPPVLLPQDASTDRLLRGMDLTPVYDFHKIGLLYVGFEQTKEQEILSNTHGSMAYMRFLSCLGDLIPLRGQEDVYTGGLDRQADEHGKYAYVWRDYSRQIVFHTSTLMPNHENDVNRASKKALIGNDYVHIVFNDSGLPYEFGTIPSQFNFVNIVVSPHSSVRDGVDYAVSDDTYFHVTLQLRPGLPDFSPAGEGCLVSSATLPRFVRNLAMQSDIISQIYLDTAESMVPFANNRVIRLHHIERYQQQLMTKRAETELLDDMTVYDFTKTLIK